MLNIFLNSPFKVALNAFTWNTFPTSLPIETTDKWCHSNLISYYVNINAIPVEWEMILLVSLLIDCMFCCLNYVLRWGNNFYICLYKITYIYLNNAYADVCIFSSCNRKIDIHGDRQQQILLLFRFNVLVKRGHRIIGSHTITRLGAWEKSWAVCFLPIHRHTAAS